MERRTAALDRDLASLMALMNDAEFLYAIELMKVEDSCTTVANLFANVCERHYATPEQVDSAIRLALVTDTIDTKEE